MDNSFIACAECAAFNQADFLSDKDLDIEDLGIRGDIPRKYVTRMEQMKKWKTGHLDNSIHIRCEQNSRHFFQRQESKQMILLSPPWPEQTP